MGALGHVVSVKPPEDWKQGQLHGQCVMEPLRALDPKAWVHFPSCHYFRCLVTLGWQRSNAIYKFTGGRQSELHVWSLPRFLVLCPLAVLNLYPFL